MNRLSMLLTQIGLLICPMLVGSCRQAATKEVPSPVLPADVSAHILASTVRIRLMVPYLDPNGNQLYLMDGNAVTALNVISDGLGTLVGGNDQALIVTHNHWSAIDAPGMEAQILDAAGTPIVYMNGDTFRSLIRYREGNIIILIAPAGLSAGTETGDGDSVEPGSIVQLVHHDSATGRLTVIPALVEKRVDHMGVPSLQLDNLNGERIEPGNSGGGVWIEGKLVASISRTLLGPAGDSLWDRVDEPLQPTDRSFAARLSPARMPPLYSVQSIVSK